MEKTGRTPKYDTELLTSHIRSFWEEVCLRVPSQFSYKTMAQYLRGKGLDVDDNYLRHNATVKTLKKEFLTSTPVPPSNDHDKILEENKKFKEFIRSNFTKSVCWQLIGKEDPCLETPSAITEEAYEKALIAPGDDPFENETMKSLIEFYQREE